MEPHLSGADLIRVRGQLLIPESTAEVAGTRVEERAGTAADVDVPFVTGSRGDWSRGQPSCKNAEACVLVASINPRISGHLVRLVAKRRGFVECVQAPLPRAI